MGASSLVRSWLAELWTDHLGVHDPGEGRTARPASFATFATAVAFGCQFDHTAPPSGRDHVADLAVDAIASGVGEGLPPVRDLFNTNQRFRDEVALQEGLHFLPEVVTLTFAPAATEDRPVEARRWCRSLARQRWRQLTAPDAGARSARWHGPLTPGPTPAPSRTSCRTRPTRGHVAMSPPTGPAVTGYPTSAGRGAAAGPGRSEPGSSS